MIFSIFATFDTIIVLKYTLNNIYSIDTVHIIIIDIWTILLTTIVIVVGINLTKSNFNYAYGIGNRLATI